VETPVVTGRVDWNHKSLVVSRYVSFKPLVVHTYRFCHPLTVDMYFSNFQVTIFPGENYTTKTPDSVSVKFNDGLFDLSLQKTRKGYLDEIVAFHEGSNLLTRIYGRYAFNVAGRTDTLDVFHLAGIPIWVCFQIGFLSEIGFSCHPGLEGSSFEGSGKVGTSKTEVRISSD
jgi:hypothetical protein